MQGASERSLRWLPSLRTSVIWTMNFWGAGWRRQQADGRVSQAGHEVRQAFVSHQGANHQFLRFLVLLELRMGTAECP
jgi:hypothetical protein